MSVPADRKGLMLKCWPSSCLHQKSNMHKIQCLYWLRCVYVKKSIPAPDVTNDSCVFRFLLRWPTNDFASPQDRQSERQKDSRLNLRPPSQSATYATVSAWHHQPEKLILDSCGYEATVSHFLLSSAWKQTYTFVYIQYTWQNFLLFHKIDWQSYFI